MPNSPIAQQALEAAQGLGAKITELSDKVDKLNTSNEELTQANKDLAESNTRHRHWIIALGVMGCFVAAVVVGLILALVKVDQANDKAVDAADVARLAQQYLEQGCAANNESRATEHALWDGLFAEDKKLAEKTGEKISPEEQAALNRIAKLVDKAYPQRDCTGVQRGEVVTITPTPTP